MSASPEPGMLIAILACHERREMTCRALRSFFGQNIPESSPRLLAVVLDDASTDGTRAAVEKEFPQAVVVNGDGTRYWSGGMRLAEDSARTMPYDWLLWLNDDVILESGAVARLIAAASPKHPRAIVVGAVRDPSTGETTYSGVRRSRWHPLRFTRIEPAQHALAADTFNGNVVLVPREICEAVDGIDGEFQHAAGDFDYGLRARKLGFDVVLAPGHFGVCERSRSHHLSSARMMREQWRELLGPKAFPPRARARFLRRHGGVMWPLFWAAPYVKFFGRSRSRRSGDAQPQGQVP